MTIFEAINKAKSEARKINIELQNYDIKRIMAYTLNISLSEMVIGGRYEEISKEQEKFFMEHIERLLNGEPLQYITNKQNFMESEFYVDENVLIPQPDTEILVEQTIEIIKKMDGTVKVLDLCTGSGAIAISLKKALGDKIQAFASDISKEALEVAKKNSKNILGEEDNIQFIQSDMFEKIDGRFNIIISNPPYIKTDVIKTLPMDVQKEPHIALDGGKDGLDFYKVIKQNLSSYLLPNGYLIVEIGFDQKEEMMQLFPNAKCIKDYADNDRIIIYKEGEK